MMAENGRELTPRQTRAVLALLAEPSLEAAAKSARISERTLRRWRGEREFSRALREAQAQVVHRAVGRLRALTDEAVETLRQLTVDANSEAVRLGASRVIIDAALRAGLLEDLAARVEVLERQSQEGSQWQ